MKAEPAFKLFGLNFFSSDTRSSRKNWTGAFERNWDKFRKKKVAFAPNFFLHKSQKLFKSSCQGKQVLCQPSADNLLTQTGCLQGGTSFPLDPLSAKGIHAMSLTFQSASANGGQSTWLATFAPLKCKPKWIFLSQQAGTKIRENEPFSLTTRQAHASLVYPFLPRLCC